MSFSFPVLNFEPQGSKQIPDAAIIVLQEWWGVNEQIKKHAQHIANNTGAHVVVPDLYKGKIGVTAEEASHLMSHLDFEAAIKELLSLVGYLKSINKTRIGAIGFCMGGALSLALANQATLLGQPIQVAITFYGTTSGKLDVTKISGDTAVQGHFGGLDNEVGFSDPPSARQLEKDVANAKDVHIYNYPEQGHGFLNYDDWSVSIRKDMDMLPKDADPVNEEKAVRDLAWSRVFNFFDKHL
ncbi:dienelactone hydrolase [Phycomyces nitens]|nr:dienelactone hydrolase [Phycomyces nitens]